MPLLNSQKTPVTIQEVLQAEAERKGWISVVTMSSEGNIVRAVSRYKRGYFHTLRKEGLLKINNDQFVVGLD